MSLDTAPRARALTDITPLEAAVFLDFDGVLVDLAPHPDAVEVAPALLWTLAVIESETRGALAIVTGREIADLRRHLPLVPQSVIGSHGAERSLTGAAFEVHPMVGSDDVQRVKHRAAEARSLAGVLVEPKPTGVAVHFREAPEQEDAVRQLCESIVAEFSGFEMISAKMAFEIRPEGVGKDVAVADAMTRPPFAGRIPVYIGDDTTDEPALAWVAAQGGVAIKVGEGASAAPHRLADCSAVHEALADWTEMRWNAS